MEVEISPQEFFAHATLKLQNSRIKGKQSFRQTKKKWRNILEREGDYLSFTQKDLVGKSAAGTEDLTELSAVVGIGCGLIALGRAFDVKINRFSLFKPTNKVMRRMDFEFIASGQRYFHESKGTTSKYTGNKDRKDILEQKKSTRKYCAKSGPNLAGSTGSASGVQRFSEFSTEARENSDTDQRIDGKRFATNSGNRRSQPPRV
jgi:hypothetical protein